MKKNFILEIGKIFRFRAYRLRAAKRLITLFAAVYTNYTERANLFAHRYIIRKIIVMVLVFLFSNIFADVASSEEIYNVYALEEEFFDTEVIHSYPCYMPYGLSDEKKAEILFKTLFNDPRNVINYIPKDTKLLEISLTDNELIINASHEIKNYGGSFYERKLVRQILYTAFEIGSVESVTLLIEGKSDYLPQGSLIEKISREEMRREYTDEGAIICNEEQE